MSKYLLLIAGMAIGLQSAGTGHMAVIPNAVFNKTSTSIAVFAYPQNAHPITIPEMKKIKEVFVTAYSSTPEETDDTPFITASGKTVRDGIVATNMLPFGTRIKIPTLFGEKIFVVEDRMHERKDGFVDVWMPTKAAAKRFGISRTDIVILDDQNNMLLLSLKK